MDSPLQPETVIARCLLHYCRQVWLWRTKKLVLYEWESLEVSCGPTHGPVVCRRSGRVGMALVVNRECTLMFQGGGVGEWLSWWIIVVAGLRERLEVYLLVCWQVV